MIYINSKSKEILAMVGRRRIEFTASVKPRTIYLSKSFCLSNDIKEGMYAHFLNEGIEWRFFVNDDSDGFLLVNAKRSSGALEIYNGALTSLIMKSTGDKFGGIYPIDITPFRQKDCPVFWIRTTKKLK